MLRLGRLTLSLDNGEHNFGFWLNAAGVMISILYFDFSWLIFCPYARFIIIHWQ
jgi:hypothetical protein